MRLEIINAEEDETVLLSKCFGTSSEDFWGSFTHRNEIGEKRTFPFRSTWQDGRSGGSFFMCGIATAVTDFFCKSKTHVWQEAESLRGGSVVRTTIGREVTSLTVQRK